MTTRSDRSNEVQQQTKRETTTSSSIEEGAGYPGYITSVSPPPFDHSSDKKARNGSCSLPPSSPLPFLSVCSPTEPNSNSSISSPRANQSRERAKEEEDCYSSHSALVVPITSAKGEVPLSLSQISSAPLHEEAPYQSTIRRPHPSSSPSPSRSSSAVLSSSPQRAVRMSSAAETLSAGGSGGTSSNGNTSASTNNSAGPAAVPESEDAAAWRNFCYEHPLHAATSAMLNLGGANALSEDAAVNTVGGNNNNSSSSSNNSSSVLIAGYDQHHYVNPYSTKSGHHHHHHPTIHTPPHSLPPLLSASSHAVGQHKEDKSMSEIWPNGMGGSHSTTEDASAGTKEIAGHPQQQSMVTEADIYPLVIKKEPEDLTRRNLRQQQQHQHVHHHPDSRIMCTTVNSSGAPPDKNSEQQHSTGTVISRVLADGELVHEMIPRLESISQPQHSMSDGRDPSGASVIHIRRPLSSNQPDGDPALLSSAVVLDLARAGSQQQQQQQYSSSPYSSSGGGLQPVTSNHGYDLSTAAGTVVAYGVSEPVSAYSTINPSTSAALRQQQQTTYATPTPVGSDPFYRDYFNNNNSGANGGSNDPQQYARAVAQLAYSNAGEVHESAFVDRFIRGQSGIYKQQQGTGLTVDLPSPDSGIGVDAVTPRDQSVAQQQNFDYTELCHPGLMPGEPPTMDHHSSEQQHHHHHPGNSSAHGGSDEGSRTPTSGGEHSKSSLSPGSGHLNSSRSRSWHDCNRQTEADKIQIPKVMNQYGFRYYLESPISTSQRREDDRITYINKGQFYGITLEYIPDPERPLKNQTVKTMVMLVFREEKSPEDEAKAWQFWHGRQHSAKQRILDADTKNSVGLVGCIEEVSHNAICVYWNPLESSAKINVAVQCLSTDFSSQKGVKGLPLHLQIDTFDDPRDSTPVFHRGYCQIKVFCDKGAERKTRDEERRAAKRKIVVTGRNKRLEELYHLHAERSEFYHMADLTKPPALFTPDDHEKISTSMDLPGFYGHDHERKDFLESHAGLLGAPLPVASNASANTVALYSSSPVLKRRKLTPPPCERVMIYVRQENELAFTPLHLVPPTSMGLLDAIESKYKLSAATINVLYRKNCKGILAKIDDDMLKHYCNEDLFILEITTSSEEGMYDVTLKELYDG